MMIGVVAVFQRGHGALILMVMPRLVLCALGVLLSLVGELVVTTPVHLDRVECIRQSIVEVLAQ